MMKKKILWLSFMAVFFILFSCRNEQGALNEASANRNRDVISFAAFQKETQIQKVGEVISPLSISQKNNQSDDPLSGFLIDTETINRIKANADISTYAFRIYSLFGNPQDVYNIVYRKRNDGTLHYSIIHIKGNTPYVLYDSEAASVAQKHQTKNSTAKTSSHEDCAASYSVSIWHCKNGHSWETCDKCPECLETLTVCVGSGGGDNSGGFGNPSDGNPSDPPPPLDPFLEGGSAAYLTDPSGYVFDPNVPPSTDEGYVRALRARLFWEQLPGALYRQWASGNTGIYHNLIENYLNNYSTGDNSNNINFTNWAIDFLMQNPDTTWEQFENWFMGQNSLSLDNSVNGSNSIVFNNLQDFKSSLALKNINLITESLVLQDNGSEKIVSARVKRTGVWGSGEEVRIKLKKVGNLWTFDSVTSSEYGITLGVWSFTQLDYAQNVNSNVLTVEVTGLENYNVFLEGLGTVYKDRVMIRVKININTGNIFSIEFIDL